MAKAVIRNRVLNYNNIRYFRAGSEKVRLGSIGEKVYPIAGANYLEVEDAIKIPKTKDVHVHTVDIDFSRTRQAKFEQGVDGRVKGVDFEGTASQTWDRLQEGKLKLLKFGMDLNDLEDLANADKDALQDLKVMGNRARIVSDVFVVASAEFVDQFGRGQTVEVSAGKGPIKVEVRANGSQSGRTTVTLGKGSTLAYLLASLDWDSRWHRRRKKIVDLDTDQQGRAEPR